MMSSSIRLITPACSFSRKNDPASAVFWDEDEVIKPPPNRKADSNPPPASMFRGYLPARFQMDDCIARHVRRYAAAEKELTDALNLKDVAAIAAARGMSSGDAAPPPILIRFPSALIR